MAGIRGDLKRMVVSATGMDAHAVSNETYFCFCHGEVLLAEGHTVAMASKKLGIAEQTYYRWRVLDGLKAIESSISGGE